MEDSPVSERTDRDLSMRDPDSPTRLDISISPAGIFHMLSSRALSSFFFLNENKRNRS